MREIKFRAWDKRHKNMEICEDLYWFEENMIRQSNEGSSTFGDYIIMQYIGFKDKYGVNIYEGDIIKSSSEEDGENILTVEWYSFKNLGSGFSFYDRGGDDDYYHDTIEIIGNIYENLELLNV